MRGGVRVPPGKEGSRAKAAPHQSASQTASPVGEAFFSFYHKLYVKIGTL